MLERCWKPTLQDVSNVAAANCPIFLVRMRTFFSIQIRFFDCLMWGHGVNFEKNPEVCKVGFELCGLHYY